jgi:SAM-dependent methyltransferase
MMGMAERKQKCRHLIHRYYKDVPSRQDMMDLAIGEALGPSTVLLDAGCGSDLPLLARYGPKVAMAIGVDLCAPSVQPPPRTHVAVANLEALPLESGSVDLLISRSVLEHLENPAPVFKEFSRVLRSHGMLVCTTPSKYYYSCLIARLTPEPLKARYWLPREDAIPFPRLLSPTRRSVQVLARASQLRLPASSPSDTIRFTSFSPFLFRLGMLYDWLITAWRLDALQSNWLVVMRKD